MSEPSSENAASAVSPSQPRKHNLWEDAQGLAGAVLVASFGVALLKAGGIISGGMPGIALLIGHVTGWKFGHVLFVANLPFYWLAIKRMGWEFTIKTFCSVVACGLVTDHIPDLVGYTKIAPVFAAVYGGLLLGIGILMFVRHRASMGGLNVLVFYLQEKMGWNAGRTQMAVDLGLMVIAFFVFDHPTDVLYSVLCVVVLNSVLWFNHRPDRYLGK